VSVTAPERPATASAPARVVVGTAIERELPDTSRAHEFGGCSMVQSFRVTLQDGVTGRCWLPTAEAMEVRAFGRQWVAAALDARAAAVGEARLRGELTAPGGLRLTAAP
jgi:hypothetical protein